MSRTRATAILALAASVALVAGGCGGSGDDRGEDGTTIEIGGEEANDHGRRDVSGETAVEFELDDHYFDPTILDGGAGQTLTLEAFNEGDAAHTFTIDGTDVDVVLQPGDRTEIEVTFPEEGAVVFHCHFHDAQGMRGALSVGGSLDVAPGGGHGEGDANHGAAEPEDDGKY